MPHNSANLMILIFHPPWAVEDKVKLFGHQDFRHGPFSELASGPKKNDFCPVGTEVISLTPKWRSASGGLHRLLNCEQYPEAFLNRCQEELVNNFSNSG
jgi:hypothetical protein